MRMPVLKNFLHCFTLKQGTIVIAISQLFGCGITITLCLLGLTHAMDIEDMVVRDSEDALEREAFEDGDTMHLNTRRMEIAHHNATERVYMIYWGLVGLVIHTASVILLLYGVLSNKRNFMTPWLLVALVECAADIIASFRVDHKYEDGYIDRLIYFFIAITILYSCFVVYSTYRSLDNKKGLTHEIHGVKRKYAQPKAESSKSRAATEPHEV